MNIIKKCRICGQEFQITNIYGGSRQFCFDCVPITNDSAERTNFKRQAIKKQGVSLLGGKCMKCGCDDYFLLNFHHLNPEQKDNTPSQLIANSQIEEFFEEIKNCILLCSNCHQTFHFLESHNNLKIEDYVDLSNWTPNMPSIDRSYSHYQHTCSCCGKVLYEATKTGLCVDCYRKSQTKNRPEPLELAKLIVDNGFEWVGRQYGVTGNAIKKWCKAYNIPYLKQELKEWLKNQG